VKAEKVLLSGKTASRYHASVSVSEIIEELPCLSPAELAAVEARLRELKVPQAGSPVTWGSSLLEIAGSSFWGGALSGPA
jgi:hypothetical protein